MLTCTSYRNPRRSSTNHPSPSLLLQPTLNHPYLASRPVSPPLPAGHFLHPPYNTRIQPAANLHEPDTAPLPLCVSASLPLCLQNITCHPPCPPTPAQVHALPVRCLRLITPSSDQQAASQEGNVREPPFEPTRHFPFLLSLGGGEGSETPSRIGPLPLLSEILQPNLHPRCSSAVCRPFSYYISTLHFRLHRRPVITVAAVARRLLRRSPLPPEFDSHTNPHLRPTSTSFF